MGSEMHTKRENLLRGAIFGLSFLILIGFSSPAIADDPQSGVEVPSVSITAPANGTSVQGNINFSATAYSNAAVDHVEFYLDDANSPLCTVSVVPFSCSWDSTTIANGSHTVAAKAYDILQNQFASSAITFNVLNPDISVPVVKITSPTSRTRVSGLFIFSATAADNAAVSRVDFFLNPQTVPICTSWTNPFMCRWDSRTLSNGWHTLTAKAYNSSGNSSISSSIKFLVSNPAVTRSVKVPIINYHNITSDSQYASSKISMTPSQFRSEMSYLKKNNYHTISLSQLYDAMYHGAKLPTKPVVITFDDGLVEHYAIAYKLLKAYNMKATFFVNTVIYDSPIANETAAKYMTSANLKEMSDGGMDIESHNRTHSYMTQLTHAQLIAGITSSAKTIEEITGRRPLFLAFPHDDYNSAVWKALKGAGYLMAVTSVPGSQQNPKLPYKTLRFGIGRTVTMKEFVRILTCPVTTEEFKKIVAN
jgi:peptidoglycan/xylan/chitin deacetylase (PgdA/CDA1 family)